MRRKTSHPGRPHSATAARTSVRLTLARVTIRIYDKGGPAPRELRDTLLSNPLWKQGGWTAKRRNIEDLGGGIAAQRVVDDELLRDRVDRMRCGRDEHLAVAPRFDCVFGHEWNFGAFDAERLEVFGRPDGDGAVEAIERARHAQGLEAIVVRAAEQLLNTPIGDSPAVRQETGYDSASGHEKSLLGRAQIRIYGQRASPQLGAVRGDRHIVELPAEGEKPDDMAALMLREELPRVPGAASRNHQRLQFPSDRRPVDARVACSKLRPLKTRIAPRDMDLTAPSALEYKGASAHE